MLTAHFSRIDWWIAAFVAGTATAVALQSLILEKKNKWKAIAPPLAAALFIVLDSALRDYEGDTPLALYTLAMLSLALTRLVFAGWIRRQLELARSGQPMEQVTRKQSSIFLLTFMAIVAAIAFTL